MDIERAVEDFVHKGKDLFDRLRAEGQTLSPLGLHILRTQLHTLHVEAARLKREKATAERANAKATEAIATQAKTKALLSTCSQDRKSTRLNSSHVEISYAVFCLKKKTT